MKPHPLPKTVAPLPDELLSGWLSRLAAANYCDDAELLAHIKIDTAHGTALDFGIDAVAAEKIASAARVAPDVVRSLTFPAMTPREASLTAQMPFQHCPQCSREGGGPGHSTARFAGRDLCRRSARTVVNRCPKS